MEELNQDLPWTCLDVARQSNAVTEQADRTPFRIKVKLPAEFSQLWSNYQDPAMEKALGDMSIYRQTDDFAASVFRLPNESAILRFRYFLKEFGGSKIILAKVNTTLQSTGLLLRSITAIHTTLSSFLSSTIDNGRAGDRKMYQTKRANQQHFKMKAQIEVNAESGLDETLAATGENKHEVTQTQNFLNRRKTNLSPDLGDQGLKTCKDTKNLQVNWRIAKMPEKYRTLTLKRPLGSYEILQRNSKRGHGSTSNIRFGTLGVRLASRRSDTVVWPRTLRDCTHCLC